MRNLLSVIIMLFIAFTSQAQLVNSLNFSTGHDNTTGTALPLGTQDPEWLVTALSTPFTPGGTIPYQSYVQGTWTPGPTTPTNTEWISYNTNSMSVGEHDPIGGTMTLTYTFETCREDYIKFSATIRSDNGILDLRVDGVSTGFTQNPMLANWVSGSSLSYAATLGAGTHTVEVDIKNVGVGQQFNPAGLNVDGVISSTNNSIIDRANYPDYRCCNADFIYCINTNNPYQVTFSADDPTQPGNFDWTVNGSYAGSGTPLVYTFAGPGTYEVCMRYYNPDTKTGCDKCVRICIAENKGGADGKPGKEANTTSGVGKAATLDINRIYPNPADKEINIDFNSGTEQEVRIQLFDMSGKVVAEKSMKADGQKHFSIATGKVPAGVYMLSISNGREIMREKVVIEK